MSWMRTATPVAADGFDQRFGLLWAPSRRPAGGQAGLDVLPGRQAAPALGGGGGLARRRAAQRGLPLGGRGTRRSAAALSAAAAVVPPPPQPLRR